MNFRVLDAGKEGYKVKGIRRTAHGLRQMKLDTGGVVD
jgi:hypothetical protein